MTPPSTPHAPTPHAGTPYAGTDPATLPGLAPRSARGPGPTRAPGSGAAGGSGLPPHLQDNPLRDAVVRRLALTGLRHTRAVTERRGRDDEPGPHVIVFFYIQPGPGRGAQVAVASRAFLRGDDVTDLATVLATLHERAREYHHLDPRRHLATTVEDMPPDATYLGVGTSTLPTIPGAAPGPVPEARPWHGLACLTDTTQLTISAQVHPHTVGGPTAMKVTSTHTLSRNSVFAASPYSWSWATTHGHRGSPLAHLLPALAGLHDHLTHVHARA